MAQVEVQFKKSMINQPYIWHMGKLVITNDTRGSKINILCKQEFPSNFKGYITNGKSWSTVQEVNNQSSTREYEWSPISNTRQENKHSSQTERDSPSINPIAINERQYNFRTVCFQTEHNQQPLMLKQFLPSS